MVTIGLSLLTGVLFGLAPAMRSTRAPPSPALLVVMVTRSPSTSVKVKTAAGAMRGFAVKQFSNLPEALAVKAAARLQSAALVVEVDVVWLESALDAEFSLIRTRRADTTVEIPSGGSMAS